ncbi:MAG TPA: oxygenase MpaB family protein [Patescibacteria group bacterium]|nr:oxygenase MpaB family protein [Patescibacteria group bacterium]
MEYFVNEGSVVRQIWGKGDTILFIFAGAAAEFALSKAIDWLYFTGRIPADPLGRLFSTVSYARKIVFAEKEAALRAIDTMSVIHSGVEARRGMSIPDWAYRDVLFMLIDYSIRSFELLERRLSEAEKHEVFDVFKRVGSRMGIASLPGTFKEWEVARLEHLHENLRKSSYTDDLYKQYHAHLGLVSYKIVLEVQKLIVPTKVHELLHLKKISFLKPLIGLYKLSRKMNLDWFLKSLILPAEYKDEIKALDGAPE